MSKHRDLSDYTNEELQAEIGRRDEANQIASEYREVIPGLLEDATNDQLDAVYEILGGVENMAGKPKKGKGSRGPLYVPLTEMAENGCRRFMAKTGLKDTPGSWNAYFNWLIDRNDGLRSKKMRQDDGGKTRTFVNRRDANWYIDKTIQLSK